MNLKRLTYSLILVFSFGAIYAQTDTPIDTDIEQDTSTLDSSYTKRNTFKEVFSGKPGRAALYSLIVPGGGQIYNKKWWKLPITYSIEGGAVVG